MGAKIKSQKNPYGFHQNPPKIVGSQINPPKNPMPNFPALKSPESKTSLVVFIHRTTQLGYAGTTMNLQIVSNTPKIPTKSSHPKIYLSNFPTQKIPRSKISNPKKSFCHPCHLKSGVTPWALSLRNEQ